MFEFPAINAEEFGKGIENDHVDLHLLRSSRKIEKSRPIRTYPDLSDLSRGRLENRKIISFKPDETGRIPSW